MNKIRVLFFATLKDRLGVTEIALELETPRTVGWLKQHLAESHPEIKALLGHSLVSINQEFAFDEDILPEGAEIAFFPPVSGGSEDLPTLCKITYDVLDLDDLVAAVTSPSTGAVAVFTGIVRGQTIRDDAHETMRLEYEAYVPMAEAKMRQVAAEIRKKWSAVEGIVIVQRIGSLQPGTPTVLIACSAAHRDTGVFEAARYGIDRLKEIVPVWKKEIKPDGEEWVEGKYHPTRED